MSIDKQSFIKKNENSTQIFYYMENDNIQSIGECYIQNDSGGYFDNQYQALNDYLKRLKEIDIGDLIDLKNHEKLIECTEFRLSMLDPNEEPDFQLISGYSFVMSLEQYEQIKIELDKIIASNSDNSLIISRVVIGNLVDYHDILKEIRFIGGILNKHGI